MRNLSIILLGIIFLGFTSCNNDEFEDVENDLSNIKNRLDEANNQHYILLDSIAKLIESNEDSFDINAVKISQNNSLFEGISRQPETASSLINASEQIYNDFTELLPFSDETILERGIALASLFEAIARQPGAVELLDSAATQFVGPFDASQMSDDFFINGKARGIALNDLFFGIARQPEAFDVLTATATKFIGDYEPTIFSDELIEVAKHFAVKDLVEGIARQPEAIDLLNSASIQFLGLSFLEESDQHTTSASKFGQ